ncbi:MAG: HAD hydrolase-like protein, partial [Dysgonamonadaceae bacterium]|nr:HAD hydrolase-like protein [Dysgonamonadaceae bacterium]
FNGQLSEQDVIQTFGLNEEGMIRKMVDEEYREKALSDFYIQYQKAHSACPAPFEGIKELIAELKSRNITVVLITGKGEKSCQITLERFGMKNSFDFIETGAPDRNIKPEALAVIQCKYNLFPYELVYIGDTVSDIISCNQARVQCLSASWAKSADTDRLLEHNQAFVFHTVKSLKEYLFQSQ